jgi:hypothetical protein
MMKKHKEEENNWIDRKVNLCVFKESMEFTGLHLAECQNQPFSRNQVNIKSKACLRYPVYNCRSSIPLESLLAEYSNQIDQNSSLW